MREDRNKRWNLVVSVIICIVFIVVATGFILNTSRLKQEVSQEAEEHTLNMSARQAGNLSYRMNIDLRIMSGLSDSIGRMRQEQVTDRMLAEKRDFYNFEQLVILGSDGSVFPENTDRDRLAEWGKNHPAIWNPPRIIACKEYGIVFSAPIRTTQSSTNYVLIGTRSYANLQEIAIQEQYMDATTNLLIDTEGNVLLGLTGADILNIDAENAYMDMLREKIGDETHQLGKSYVIKLDDGSDLLVSMHDLNVNDWVQVTIVPWTASDAFARHLKIYLLLCTVFVVISAILIVFIRVLYNQAKKKWDEVFYHDFVTGGLTNKAFQVQCAELLHRENQIPYAIVYFDMREFEHINETWGFESGNETLRYVHNCLKQKIADDELVARSEVDHFFLLLHAETADNLKKRVEEILKKINAYDTRYREQYVLDFAVGAYIIADTYERIPVMQDRARRAAKFHDTLNACTFYDDRVVQKIDRQNRLNALFNESLENHDFQVYLQPKVYLQQNKPCAAEALVRWIHPDEGIIYPSDFVPLFEENGKICKLDLYMFEEVCKIIDRWRREGRRMTEISVNISRENLCEANINFHKKYCEIKQQYNIPDGVIQIELTETTMLYAQQFPYVSQIIEDFHNAGFLCALDDFGFGYSSLALLKEFSIDAIKLDRSFFINENPKSKIVVANMIRLAHDMNIQIVAEGIEDERQVDSLYELGCDLIQGYFYSQPLPTKQFEIWQDREIGVTT